MSNEEEDAEFPSAPRRKEVELGKGVVILPPERMREERERKEAENAIIEEKPERKLPLPPQKPVAQQQQSSGIALILVGILAVVAIALSIIAMTSVTSIKGEIKGIAADLRDYKESTLSLKATLSAAHKVEASVPLKDVISSFTLPVAPQDLKGTGAITVFLPSIGSPVTIPWNGTITVLGTIEVNTSNLAEDRKLKLSYTLPNIGEQVLSFSAGDLFSESLNNISTRLERLSK